MQSFPGRLRKPSAVSGHSSAVLLESGDLHAHAHTHAYRSCLPSALLARDGRETIDFVIPAVGFFIRTWTNSGWLRPAIRFSSPVQALPRSTFGTVVPWKAVRKKHNRK